VGDRAVPEYLQEYLRPKRLLLVLDNIEHVLDAAPLIADLTATAPGVTILLTSRIRLRLYAEHEFPVPALALPTPGPLPTLAALPDYAAVALFLRRAGAVRPDFALTEMTAAVVAEICAQLDGLPLAIELAAARIRLLPPQALLARLSRRLHLLTGGARDLPARQQTLRGTIDWSYALLGPGERRLFARLAVFVGGWTPEAAEAVCNPAGDLPLDTLEGLASLLDQSLIQREEEPTDGVRFTLLETIREYAWERLRAQGEESLLRQRHADYYLALAEEAAPRHFWIPRETWLARLPFEGGNLRAALVWFRDEAERPSAEAPPDEKGLRMAGALWRFWDIRGYWRESREWLEGTLAWAGPGRAPRTAARATALLGLGMLEFDQGNDQAAAARLAESLAIRRELGDAPGIALGLFFVGLAAMRRGDLVEGRRRLGESLTQYDRLGDGWGRAMVLHIIGEGVALDDPALAQRHHAPRAQPSSPPSRTAADRRRTAQSRSGGGGGMQTVG
jgi:predicted ATPase